MAESAADCRITTVPNGFLTKKQDDVLIALLSSNSIEDASKASGVSKTTIFKYLQIDSFRESYRKARAETVSHAITQIQSACSEAVQVLRDIMNDKESPAASRVPLVGPPETGRLELFSIFAGWLSPKSARCE